MGTRFLPATKAQPKEMLPLVDKPIIQYVVEEAVQSGIENIIIITGRGKNAIEDHFDVSYELEKILEERGQLDLLSEVRKVSDLIHVSYVRQKEALGLGHAILMARELVGEEPFAVLLADDLIDADPPATAQMAARFESEGCSLLGVEEVPREQTGSYGIVSTDSPRGEISRIRGIIEKPAPEESPSTLAVVGRYVLTPRIFTLLSEAKPGRGGEIQLTDAISALLQHEQVLAMRMPGRRYDCGSKLGYLKASVEYGLRHPETGIEFEAYLRRLGR